MTDLLEEAISRIRELSQSDQDLAAEALFTFLDRDQPTYTLTPGQVETVQRTMAGVRDGTIGIASDEEVAAMWQRLGA